MTGTQSVAPELVLVRYGELAIKGKNRFEFENALVRNIVQAASPISPVRVEKHRGRLTVHAERRTERVARRLQDVFGIASVSAARRADKDVEAIAAVAREELAHALEAWPPDRRIRFRVTTRRADKTFPLTSTELDRAVADLVMPEHEARLVVDLTRPELELEVDLRPHAAYVFATRLPGPGGLPVGTLGKGVCLLSGGIDSPVAAWMCMKRGCAVVFVSFHSFPYIGEASRRKIEHLVERLARFQPRSRLYSVPFTDVQTAIRDTAPEGYRTVLYRRQMQRIASRIARREKAGCLITGESLGQVASQTMENLTCIGAASDLPVLRPLIGFDKQETIDLARRIGTYDTSIVPEPDCCTVFMPKRPVIRGRIDRCEEAEAALPLDELLTAAVEGAERQDIT